MKCIRGCGREATTSLDGLVVGNQFHKQFGALVESASRFESGQACFVDQSQQEGEVVVLRQVGALVLDHGVHLRAGERISEPSAQYHGGLRRAECTGEDGVVVYVTNGQIPANFAVMRR